MRLFARLFLLLFCLATLAMPAAFARELPTAPQHHPMQSMDHGAMLHASASNQSSHDCCDMASQSNADQNNCDTGGCLFHCAAPLLNTIAVVPGRIQSPAPPPAAIIFSSITLDTPSRPPSAL